MELTDISYEKINGVAEVALNRPEKRNTISGNPGGTRDQILWCLDDAEGDAAVGAVLLRGEGTTFSGGGDLTGNKPRETLEEHTAFLQNAAAFHERIVHSPLPVVAAVQGLCLGAAVSLVASADFIVASEDAKFSLPEGRIGLVGATPLVPLVGPQWAKFMMLTGEMIDAALAQRIGLVLSVEPVDGYLDRARELCRRLARLPREANGLNLATIDAVASAGDDRVQVGIAHDAQTLLASPRATAPDGRSFREIIAAEGIAGLKAARESQFTTPWLRENL